MNNLIAFGILALLALGAIVILTGDMTFVNIFMVIFG